MERVPEIKIYVSCHKDCYVPDNSLLYPIQVGAATAEKRLEGMLMDDIGDNISSKNKMYCELTAQYWVWKHEVADYYGFFHYRRYFSFNPGLLEEDGWGNIEYREPFMGLNLNGIMLDEKQMKRIISNYDIILPRRRSLSNELKRISIKQQYNEAQGQHMKDLDAAVEIILEKFPEYYEAVQSYLNSSEAYECNMFIMKKELFDQYSEWLFSILFELEARSDYSNYNETELRAVAYLGERLLGIWYTYISKKRKLKVLELQKTLFRNTDKLKKIEHKNDAVITVLSSNNNFIPYAAVMLQSICNNINAESKYEIYILHVDITDKNKEIIDRMSNCYSNVNIYFIDVRLFLQDINFFVDEHVTIETYYRLFIPEIFCNAEKVLYLDCDMVVRDDIAKLFNLEIGDCYAAAVKDIDIAGRVNKDNQLKKYINEEVGHKDETKYFQAGVLILNLKKIRNKFTTSQLIGIAQKHHWKYWDQDVLNYAFGDNIYYLNQEWNVLMNWQNDYESRLDTIKLAPYKLYEEYKNARRKPEIIHYAGYQKPWNVPQSDMANYFWQYARQTPYYESILEYNLINKFGKTVVTNELQTEKEVSEGLVKQVDNQGIKIKGVNETLYVDGVMVKLISLFNKKYPIGSKKRNRLRKLVKIFIR